MSDRDGAPDPSTSARDTELSARLRDLGQRLRERRGERVGGEPPKEVVPRNPNVAMALRVSSDLVGGVIVGAALGWGFDRLFGTSPWGLIVLVLLGFAAGLRNVVKSTGLSRSSTGGADGAGDGK
jgi:ATP synthase protein I